MEGGEGVCLEAEAERLWRSGMDPQEISERMGVDPGWVEALVSMWEPEEQDYSS
ncbi:MAG: hypothetical protein K6T51_03050 [Rubrobacteraceae bacterium]|uniref:hypothetical protein n=1 Tax=Rubrobacter naiadicus TaxID=1392641 RepID=UPI00235F1595|nr:hypothetical protein [Rubrobacter naiadicus]MBX6764021.1 hypothetical protein [Rubrobacteraceae bacterium]MCL6437564.1 hypothetical protein [Rubrobacteraceae bacterium]